jgi:branched-chain amino acid transport system substrate-binding protein
MVSQKTCCVGIKVAAIILAMAAAIPAKAQQLSITLGVLTDMNGFVADATGRGSVVAAELAAETFMAETHGATVRVISADHQNKADIGSAIAHNWIDREGVNAILDVPFSSVALAVNEVTRGSAAAFLASGPGAVALTGERCSPNTVHWTYDTWALANGTAQALTQAGGDTWFFITADYAFGQSLEADATKVVLALGGKVLGDAKHPPSGSDFSSYLIAAQASGAKVVGLANAVTDTTNSIKQAAEFGLTSGGKQRLAALLLQVTDVNALGLQAAQGLYLTDAFYWDMNEGTRAFSSRYAARMRGGRPTSFQAGVYSSALAYLRAAKRVGSSDARKVLAEMRRAPIDDALFGNVQVRPDGRAVHTMFLFQVKAPAESKGPWDFYKLLATIPADQAFRPLGEGGCKLGSP